MATLQGQIEKMYSDVTGGPDLGDSIEVGVLGAAIGAAIGYLKDRRSAKSFAAWGAGLGVAGQYLLFQMLKPAVRGGYAPYGRYYVGDDSGGGGDGWPTIMPATGCPDGTYWSDWYGACVQNIPSPPPPAPLPGSLSEWEALHAGDHFVGAVKGIGGFRGGQMPFGPGPWPTAHVPAPEASGR